MHGVTVGDKHYSIVPDGSRWAVRRESDGKIMSRHREMEGAEAKIAEMQQSEPNARDRVYRQGGPGVGRERYTY